jgi:hypothetical protein
VILAKYSQACVVSKVVNCETNGNAGHNREADELVGFNKWSVMLKKKRKIERAKDKG